MRIGIDYTSAAHQGAGIGRLTRNVIDALAQIDRENQYKLLVQGRDLLPNRAPVAGGGTDRLRNVASGIRNGNFAQVCTWIDERWWARIWHRFHIPIRVEWIVGQVDLFHGPDFVLPPLQRKTKAIVTVHDLSYLRLPHCFQPALLDYLVANVPRAVTRADWVLADSESTRRDAIELLNVLEDRVSVLYPGVEPRFRPIANMDERRRVRAKYELPERFILTVGTIQPRKNYGRLVQAFAQLQISDLHLVIVGGKGWLYDELFRQVRDLHLEDRILFAGYVDDSDLPLVYNLAEVFVFPSLYEGFGIPPLEAMACGIPVVSANNSSLPEAVGDAGLLVDAQNVQAIADALSRTIHDQALAQTLSARGIERARQFTWEKAARTLLSTYLHVGGI